MLRLASLALLAACASASPDVPLAVAPSFSCLACADTVVCQPHSSVAAQIRLPNIHLPTKARVKLVADDDRVCALVDDTLHCWRSPAFAAFTGPTRETGVVDVALANSVRCVARTSGELRCDGSPALHPDMRSTHVERHPDGSRTVTLPTLSPSDPSQTRDEHRRLPHARARLVAAHFWGACFVDRDEAVTCWQWSGDALHTVRAPGSAPVRALRGLADVIEIEAVDGTRTVAFDPHRFDAPPRIRAVVPAPDERSRVHTHGLACRLAADSTITCESTPAWSRRGDRGAPFTGWPAPPRCETR